MSKPFYLFLILSQSLFAHFTPFTGKVTGNRVRLRSGPDLEHPIIKEVHKDELFLVKGEIGNFYIVAPPSNLKGYVFRSYLIDQIVEARNVNIRLQPSTNAPIIGSLKQGTKVSGHISTKNHKWIELDSPKQVSLYISKDYLTKLGGPDLLPNLEKRKAEVEDMLSSCIEDAKAECAKDFSKMHINPIVQRLEKIIRNYTDFPHHLLKAKEVLAALKENYLNKKEFHLNQSQAVKKTPKKVTPKKAPMIKKIPEPAVVAKSPKIPVDDWEKELKSPKLRRWTDVEKDLFLSWRSFHPQKNKEDFYLEQKANATTISGKLAPYNHQVKNKPGDFLILQDGVPIAYVYSTSVDLEKWIGKYINLKVTPRPNHHFAFPAYFVLEMQD
jgi:uncharacterized protein YgiM (DUF1202 family)